MKIIHLSDLHFHRKDSDNEDVIDTLNKIGLKFPNHYLVVNGDIVDDSPKCLQLNQIQLLLRPL